VARRKTRPKRKILFKKSKKISIMLDDLGITAIIVGT
jgi:hypothetical protein